MEAQRQQPPPRSHGLSPSSSQHPSSAWHSPVPYLFGGLAAMLGLIAFALLILACSYWKLSGYLDSGENNENGDGDLESGKINGDGSNQKGSEAFEEKILVIMAGELKPTYLATPVMPSGANNNSKDGGSFKSCSCGGENSSEKTEVKESGSGGGDSGDQVEPRNMNTDVSASSSDLQNH